MKNLNALTLITLFSAAFIFLQSCATESAQDLSSSDIQGKWVLKEAFRGGKETQTLSGVYFEFTEDGKVKTNFNRESQDQILDYEVKEGKISMKGASNLNGVLNKDTEGLLTLNTSLADFKFKLILEPAAEDE